MRAQRTGRLSARQQHRLQRALHPAPTRGAPCVRCKQRSGSHWLGENQHVAVAQAALAQDALEFVIDQAIDREAQRQFAAFAGVSTYQRTAGSVEYIDRAVHHLQQQLLNLGVQARRDCCQRRCTLRFGAHRIQVPQRVVRCDLSEHIGVLDKGAEEVHAMHQRLASRHTQHRCVIGRAQADQYIVARDRPQAAQRARQNARADLCAAATATHRHRRKGLARLAVAQRQCRRTRRPWCQTPMHRRQLVEATHEPPVDPVLPTPDPEAGKPQGGARSHRVSIPGADQRQPAALRRIGPQPAIRHRAAQIVRQRAPHSHRENPRLLQRATVHARHIANGKNQRVADRLKAAIYAHATIRIKRQSGVAQPRCATGTGDPYDFVGVEPSVRCGAQATRRHFQHGGPTVHLDPARAQYRLEAPLHAGVVRWQNGAVGGKQMENHQAWVAAQRQQFGAQAMLHRQ